MPLLFMHVLYFCDVDSVAVVGFCCVVAGVGYGVTIVDCMMYVVVSVGYIAIGVDVGGGW